MKMRLDRLETLAKHLETVPPETFNLGSWKCGTTACAMGHACSIPSFRRAGLRLEKEMEWGEAVFIPSFKCEQDFDAAQRFFGISQSDSYHLFDPMEYPNYERTRKQTVINRIRKFIAQHQGVKA